jgi:drug/metabolite transporter (DMT)-like permease
MVPKPKTISFAQTLIYTLLALTAFAANSVICRLALKEHSIDPGLFTAIRLISGALVLILLVSYTQKTPAKRSKGSWLSGFILFVYAAAFSFAYISLDTGTGALILFGMVQITMISSSLIRGYKLSVWEGLGIFLALAGFAYLMIPGAKSPSLWGFVLMSLSGIGWGTYSLRGKGSINSLQDNAYNFLRSVPFLVILLYFIIVDSTYSGKGILLALLSGVVTSGLGYTIWYMALRGLNGIQASVVQLFVPVLATLGGIILLGETISFKFVLAALLILGGILLLMLKRVDHKSLRDTPVIH